MSLLAQNVLGLSHSKAEHFVKLLSTHPLILLSETWHMNLKMPFLNEYILAHSPPPPQTKTQGHANGGLLILSDQDSRLNSKVLATGEYFILFRYFSHTILFVYLPPSLSDGDVESIFESIKAKPTLLIGDFNVRLGAINDDVRSGPNSRCSLIFKFCSRWNISWLQNENSQLRISRVDHIFSSPKAISSWNFFDTIIDSDHGFMEVNFTPHIRTIPKVKGVTPTRFNIRKLASKDIRHSLRNTYNSFRTRVGLPSLSEMVTCLNGVPLVEADGLHTIVDSLYSTLSDQITEVSRTILDKYNVSSAKVLPDNLLLKINDAETNLEAIMLFKRANRGNETLLTSLNPEINEYEAAKAHYSYIWNKDDLIGQANLATPELHSHNLESPFSEGAIQAKILNYSSTKSCGLDGIHIRILKVLVKSNMIADLKLLFDFFYYHGATPSQWNSASTVLLPKVSGNPDVTNTRPISLTLVLRRIFESVLHSSWSDQPWSKLHPSQAGSRKGFSCLTHALVNDHLSKQGMVHSVLLDLTKAFDSVRHADILRKLRLRNTPPGLIKLIWGLFMNQMQTRLVVNHVSLEPIPLTNGIFQGSVLSPFLFEIWIDDLLQELNPGVSFMNALGYVDDIILKAESNESMNALLSICERWSVDNHATFSSTKSFSLVSEGSSSRFLYNMEISVAPTQKYLGVEVSSKGIQWDKFLLTRTTKASGLLNFCRRVGSAWSEAIKLQIYKTFIQPQLDYMGPALSQVMDKVSDPVKTKVSLLFQNSLAWLFGTMKGHPKALLQSMTMLRDPFQRWGELSTTFAYKKESLDPSNPINAIKTLMGPGPWSAGLILPRMFLKSKDLLSYERYLTTIEAPQKAHSLKIFLNKNFIVTRAKTSTMASYIKMTARKPQSYIDLTIYISDPNLRAQALAWRRNVLFQRKQCFKCLTPFRRTHVDSCNLLGAELVPSSILLGIQSMLARVGHSVLDASVSRSRTSRISILDIILNAQEWHLLKECFSYLISQFD